MPVTCRLQRLCSSIAPLHAGMLAASSPGKNFRSTQLRLLLCHDYVHVQMYVDMRKVRPTKLRVLDFNGSLPPHWVLHVDGAARVEGLPPSCEAAFYVLGDISIEQSAVWPLETALESSAWLMRY